MKVLIRQGFHETGLLAGAGTRGGGLSVQRSRSDQDGQCPSSDRKNAADVARSTRAALAIRSGHERRMPASDRRRLNVPDCLCVHGDPPGHNASRNSLTFLPLFEIEEVPSSIRNVSVEFHMWSAPEGLATSRSWWGAPTHGRVGLNT